MPIHGYPGGVITANPTAPTVSSASGVWTTEQQLQAVSQGNWPGYEYPISRSLRFNSADSAYLNRTPASAGNRKTWTWSGWVKRGALGGINQLFAARTGGVLTYTLFYFDTTDTDKIKLLDDGGATLTSSSLYRDPSAWYHIILAVDTTQATSSNRVKIYVNGTQLTAFSTATYPSQNADLNVNSTATHLIGQQASNQYFDGYLTEINFIDGQALTPSSFGLNDPETGVWSPKRYTGTYGTNGFYLPFSDNSTALTGNALTYSEDFGNASWLKYQSTVTTDVITAPNGTTTADKLIETATSGDHQVYKTFSATDNTTYTLSTYAKAGERSIFRLYVQKKDGATYSYVDFELSTGTKIAEHAGATGTITNVGNGWYRCTLSVNVGTGATASPVAILSYATISTGSGTNGLYIWGAQLETASSVGPYFATVASTITNAYRIGADQSLPTGGYNSWVTNNLSVTAGAGNDSLVDSPTSYGTDTGVGGEVRGNYCTLNPLNKQSNLTLSNGNLDTSSPVVGTWRSVVGTVAMTSGKWYWEATAGANGAANHYFVGIAATSFNALTDNLYIGSTTDTWGYYGANGAKYNNSTGVGYGATYTTNDVIGIAYDADSGTLTFYKNGVSQGTAYTGLTGAMVAGTTGYNGSGMYHNFGQRAFAYTAPSGFKALCTQNLPTPTIGATSTTQANRYMDIKLYTGNGGQQTQTGLNFQPDFIWVKSRSNAYNNGLANAVTGTGKYLVSNSMAAEVTDASGSIIAFNADGFGQGGSNPFGANAATYVAWCWRASNAAGVTNTAGTITSTVSASTTSGFSIVTYTGTGANATVGHGLGVAPAMLIIKNRNGSTSWIVGHRGLTNQTDRAVYLDTTNAEQQSSLYWNNTAPTSTVFSVAAYGPTNGSGNSILAYCFAPVAGYSAFGSYTGNGSTDGPFVYTGFRPRYVMIKRTDSTSDWTIYDTSRSTYNQMNLALYANLSNAEGTTIIVIDTVSNGIKIRNSNADTNASGGTYIYACFAESPFKYALAR